MGTVFEAYDPELRRTVALKILTTITGASSIRRFRREARILANLNHPGIAEVHGHGLHDDGLAIRPWYTMEMVPEARPITEYARSRRLSVAKRLELVALVCEAVRHGHDRGIIHRDLKPANILVDGDGAPRVIDFGVAHIAADQESPDLTRTIGASAALGTIAYMSPEQLKRWSSDPSPAAGPASTGDTGPTLRSDVYALGVVLYELLTGRSPHDLASSSPFELARRIRDEEPPPPSWFRPELRGDVETIVLQAMARDPARRYESVGALRADLLRVLEGLPIAARRDRLVAQLARRIRRNRVAAILALTAITTTATATFVFASLYREAERARRGLAERVEQIRYDQYVDSIVAAQDALEDDEPRRAAELLARCPEDLRGWEWSWLERVRDLAVTRRRLPEGRWPLALSPDGTRLIVAEGSSIREPVTAIEVLDAETFEVLARCALGETWIRNVTWAADGASFAVGTIDAWCRIYETKTAELRLEFEGASRPDHGQPQATIIAELDQVLSCDYTGRISLRSLRTGAVLWSRPLVTSEATIVVHVPSATFVAASRDGAVVGGSLEDGSVHWSSDDGRASIGTVGMVMAPDGRTAYSLRGGEVRAWSTADGRSTLVAEYEELRGFAIAMAPDGSTLVWQALRRLELLDLESGRRQAIPGPTDRILSLHVGAEDGAVTCLLVDGTVSRYEPRPHVRRLPFPGLEAPEYALDWSRDGRWLAVGGRWQVAIANLETGEVSAPSTESFNGVNSVAFDESGRRLLVTSRGGQVSILSVPGLERVSSPEPVRSVAAAWLDEDRILVPLGAAGLGFFDAARGSLLHAWPLPFETDRVSALEVSPTQRHVILVDRTHGTWLVPIADRVGASSRDEPTPRRIGPAGISATFSSRGDRIALHTVESIELWETATGTRIRTFASRDPEEFPGRITFFDRDTRLATVSFLEPVTIWDVRTGRRLMRLPTFIHRMVFHPGLRRLVGIDLDRRAVRLSAPLDEAPSTGSDRDGASPTDGPRTAQHGPQAASRMRRSPRATTPSSSRSAGHASVQVPQALRMISRSSVPTTPSPPLARSARHGIGIGPQAPAVR